MSSKGSGRRVEHAHISQQNGQSFNSACVRLFVFARCTIKLFMTPSGIPVRFCGLDTSSGTPSSSTAPGGTDPLRIAEIDVADLEAGGTLTSLCAVVATSSTVVPLRMTTPVSSSTICTQKHTETQ